jgi:hypothetical protein
LKHWAGALIGALFTAACAVADPAPAAEAQPVAQATHPEHEHREPIRPLSLQCAGALTQGGIALCRTEPGDQLYLGDELVATADAQGWAVIQ